jgi:hypothetical protein
MWARRPLASPRLPLRRGSRGVDARSQRGTDELAHHQDYPKLVLREVCAENMTTIAPGDGDEPAAVDDG